MLRSRRCYTGHWGGHRYQRRQRNTCSPHCGGQTIAREQPNFLLYLLPESSGTTQAGRDWRVLFSVATPATNQALQVEGGPPNHAAAIQTLNNSGILSCVRIEFAGSPCAPTKEINGLTLGSVGGNTQIDHIQVSYSTMTPWMVWRNSKSQLYLVATIRGTTTDADNGYRGTATNLLGIRHPRIKPMPHHMVLSAAVAAMPNHRPPYLCNVNLYGPSSTDVEFETPRPTSTEPDHAW